VNLAESIQHGGVPAPGSVAPSILEVCMSDDPYCVAYQCCQIAYSSPSLLQTGKAFTAKGMQVLELVGKETIDLLITETGIEVEKNSKETEQQADEDQLYEEVTFDRCFYIYGGPEQLEVTFLTLKLNLIVKTIVSLKLLNCNTGRSWRHCPTIMPCYVTEEKQNYHRNRNLYLMESLSRSSKFSV
jgi:hypothetical protein